jgi:hypothetical protein
MEDDGQVTAAEGSAPPAGYAWMEEFGPGVDEAIRSELHGSSSRSVALISVARLEAVLRKCIEVRIAGVFSEESGLVSMEADKQKELKVLVGSDEEDIQPRLGFKDQARLAYCLGLIGPVALADCGVLGRIRNRFAHRAYVLSFLDPLVSSQCVKLQGYRVLEERLFGRVIFPDAGDTEDTWKRRFMNTANCITSMAWRAARNHPWKKAKVSPERIADAKLLYQSKTESPRFVPIIPGDPAAEWLHFW